MAEIKRTSDEFSRPANTTAYTAKDVVGDGTVRSITPDAGTQQPYYQEGGVITKFRLMANDKTLTNRFRLHLFHAAPTAIADNVPNTLLWANRNKRLGFVDFPAMSTEDATGSDSSTAVLVNQAFSYQLGNDVKLYYVLETLDAFTPASGTTFFLEIESTLPA